MPIAFTFKREFRVVAQRLASALLTLLGLLVPKSARKIVVHSSPDFEDGALALIDGLVKRGHLPTVLLERPPGDAAQARRPKGLAVVEKNSWRGRFAYLRASTVFTTHGAFRSHYPPPTQRVVHIWHGEPVVKPTGRGDGERPVRSTLTTVLSRVGQAFRAAETDMHLDRVLIVGAPRNDRLLATDRLDAKQRALPGAAGTSVIAWLPTYRERSAELRSGRVDGVAYAGVLPMPVMELAALDHWLADRGITFLAKPHPSALRQPMQFKNITIVDDQWLAERNLTTYEMLAMTDVLITDASSVWVDFLLLDRPIIFAFPDLNEYENSRGLNLEPYASWIPGPLVADASALIQEIDQVLRGCDRFAHDRDVARIRLHKYHDANSTGRLLTALEL